MKHRTWRARWETTTEPEIAVGDSGRANSVSVGFPQVAVSGGVRDIVSFESPTQDDSADRQGVSHQGENEDG
jgi:hypothetical protein